MWRTVNKRPLLSRRLEALTRLDQRAIAPVGIFKAETIERTNFTNEFGDASERIMWLGIMMCWHLEPERYPSVDNYWDLNAYNRSPPFVKVMPQLAKHAEDCLNHATEASKSAITLTVAPQAE